MTAGGLVSAVGWLIGCSSKVKRKPQNTNNVTTGEDDDDDAGSTAHYPHGSRHFRERLSNCKTASPPPSIVVIVVVTTIVVDDGNYDRALCHAHRLLRSEAGTVCA